MNFNYLYSLGDTTCFKTITIYECNNNPKDYLQIIFDSQKGSKASNLIHPKSSNAILTIINNIIFCLLLLRSIILSILYIIRGGEF
jgi:hypothetical protein